MSEKATPQKSGGFDLQKDKEQFAVERAKLDEAKKAFEGMPSSLTEDFKAKLPSLLSDNEKDTLDLDGDPVKQFDILFSKYKQNVLDPLDKEREALEQFEEQLDEKELHIASLEAEEKFRNSNPDVDFESIIDWYENDLPNRAKEELAKNANDDYVKFLELVRDAYEEQVSKSKGKEEQEPKLPKDINSVAGTSGDLDKGSDADADAASILFAR